MSGNPKVFFSTAEIFFEKTVWSKCIPFTFINVFGLKKGFASLKLPIQHYKTFFRQKRLKIIFKKWVFCFQFIVSRINGFRNCCSKHSHELYLGFLFRKYFACIFIDRFFLLQGKVHEQLCGFLPSIQEL